MNNKGIVYLVGAGPGDPGLFTLKGKSVLEKADVVVYDRLVSSKILSYAKPDAEMIYVGKVSGKHAMPQEEINLLLVKLCLEDKIVVRLKGGDPYMYGRGGEEALVLYENECLFEVIPGISSAYAVPAYAGIPVTHRDMTSSFAVITGHEKPGKHESSIQWDKISTGIGTLVFLMGVENLSFIVSQLIENGRSLDTPVALVRWGTTPEQEVITGTLDDIVQKVQDAKFKPPAIIIVGEVVNLRKELNWLEKKVLWGKSIVVTRARVQASKLLDIIEELGGEAIEFPSIEIAKEKDLSKLHQAFSNLDKYQWLIFTSVNAVEIFFEELLEKDYDVRDLKNILICAIGPATAKEVKKRGLKVDIIPNEYRAEAIIEEMSTKIQSGDKVLLPRARGARAILPDSLSDLGAEVDEIHIYEALTASLISQEKFELIKQGHVDYITFTSSSTVSNFVKLIGRENVCLVNEKVKIACIGPITAETAIEHGFSIDILAENYTIDGLVEALLKFEEDLKGEENKK